MTRRPTRQPCSRKSRTDEVGNIAMTGQHGRSSIVRHVLLRERALRHSVAGLQHEAQDSHCPKRLGRNIRSCACMFVHHASASGCFVRERVSTYMWRRHALELAGMSSAGAFNLTVQTNSSASSVCVIVNKASANPKFDRGVRCCVLSLGLWMRLPGKRPRPMASWSARIQTVLLAQKFP